MKPSNCDISGVIKVGGQQELRWVLMGKRGVFYPPTHPSEQERSSRPPASRCLADGPKRGVFQELVLAQLAETRADPCPDLCSLLPTPSEPTRLPAALEEAPQGDAVTLCCQTSLLQSHSDT